MKILTFKRLIGLAAIGGVAYIHKQRGGEWTVASITDTLKSLWSSAAEKLGSIKSELKEEVMQAPQLGRSESAGQQGAESSSSGEGSSGRGTRGRTATQAGEHQHRSYGEHKNDTGRH